MTLTFRWPWPLRHVLVEYKHVQLKDRENMMFYSFDLDFDPITLVLKLDLDMVKMYLHYKNEVPSYSCSKVIVEDDLRRPFQTSNMLSNSSASTGNFGIVPQLSWMLNSVAVYICLWRLVSNMIISLSHFQDNRHLTDVPVHSSNIEQFITSPHWTT